jgi:hypothetical protein
MHDIYAYIIPVRILCQISQSHWAKFGSAEGAIVRRLFCHCKTALPILCLSIHAQGCHTASIAQRSRAYLLSPCCLRITPLAIFCPLFGLGTGSGPFWAQIAQFFTSKSAHRPCGLDGIACIPAAAAGVELWAHEARGTILGPLFLGKFSDTGAYNLARGVFWYKFHVCSFRIYTFVALGSSGPKSSFFFLRRRLQGHLQTTVNKGDAGSSLFQA